MSLTLLLMVVQRLPGQPHAIPSCRIPCHGLGVDSFCSVTVRSPLGCLMLDLVDDVSCCVKKMCCMRSAIRCKLWPIVLNKCKCCAGLFLPAAKGIHAAG